MAAGRTTIKLTKWAVEQKQIEEKKKRKKSIAKRIKAGLKKLRRIN